jgi:MFS transporter, putative metabolite transport protein
MSQRTQPAAGPDKGFLRKITVASTWGQGLDGYDLGLISVALPFVIVEQHASPLWAGLIGASSLIGIFFGGPIFGWITDRLGRRVLFTLDLGIFLVASVAQVFTTELWQLFVVRLVLGLAIGAEYSIGAPMLAEFSPSRGRGRRLAGLEVSWYFGYVVAVAVSYGLLDLLHVHWRWVLASGAVPALICLIVRHGLPESPRWLMSRGRADEAREIVDTYLGGAEFTTAEDLEEEAGTAGGSALRALFAPGQRSRTIFCCVFYICLVTPYFAIFTFAPVVLTALGISDEALGVIVLNSVAFLGALAGMFAIERVGRRHMLIGPFWISALALFVIGVWTGAPSGVVVVCFVAFAFLNSASSDLTPVYPSELFPTPIRTTGTGLATAASRVGAAVGTFLLPTSLDAIGVGPTMIIAAGIAVVGAVTTQWLAPETTDVTLAKVATLVPRPRLQS